MIPPSRRHTAALCLIAGCAARAAGAQFGPPDTSRGPTLPVRGTIARDTAYERKVLEQIKAPDGVALTLFAGPPVAMYPTVVAPAPDGSVYVGVDLNLAQGAVKGRGRVMRLVDTDGDGRADRYTTFLDVDSPRGIATDGGTVYVMHPPNLTAYRDRNGDGVADDSLDLVKGIGFGLDVRSSDHSTNNITLGPDGWIYVAVGDYGYRNATGRDGATITRHGGSLARVRPDGTGLEVYAVGTRNIYDVGVDPFGHVFTRDNTNDGGGWDTRFHYLAPNADMGYPTLFRYFREEHMPSIADYGAGSGTAGLWVQDPGVPARWNNALYTGDWTVNRVFHHVLAPKGASFGVEQHDFMTVPRAVDFSADGRSHLYVASLIGGVFNYAGDTVGAIVRASFPGTAPARALDLRAATDAQLVAAVASDNAMQRVWAQQELVRRGAKPATVAALGAAAADARRPRDGRASAIFTLRRLAGERATATLVRLAGDPAVREVALRALADDRRLAKGVPTDLYVRALADTSDPVRVQALAGLVRLGATDRAAAIVPLLTSSDSALAHLAVRSLTLLGARDVALGALTAPGSSAALRTRARQVLQQLHDEATVTALLGASAGAQAPAAKHEALLALERLFNTDGPWNGDWWGTHPDVTGPYFAPAAWAASPRIRPALREALLAVAGDTAALAQRVGEYARNRVFPFAATRLMLAAAPADRTALVDALLGSSQISGAAAPLLARLDAAGPALHAGTVTMLAGEPNFGAQPTYAVELLPLVRRAALDPQLSDSVRAQVLTAVSQLKDADAAVSIFALLNPKTSSVPAGAAGAAQTPTGIAPNGVTPNGSVPNGGVPNVTTASNPSATGTTGAGAGGAAAGTLGGAAAAPAPAGPAGPVEAAWRRYVGARERYEQLDRFIELARSGDPAQRTLAYAVLVQSVRSPRAPAPIRAKVAPAIAAAWGDSASTPSLVEAITIMRVQSQYAERLQAYERQQRAR